MILKKIKALCRKNHISISRLEKECGIGNCTICKWDKSSPRVDSLQKVADFFGVGIEYFLSNNKKK